MMRMAGSPTRKRRTGPTATDAFMDRLTVCCLGVVMAAKACMALCMAKAAAVARRPVSRLNQQVIASPAKAMALPP